MPRGGLNKENRGGSSFCKPGREIGGKKGGIKEKRTGRKWDPLSCVGGVQAAAAKMTAGGEGFRENKKKGAQGEKEKKARKKDLGADPGG